MGRKRRRKRIEFKTGVALPVFLSFGVMLFHMGFDKLLVQSLQRIGDNMGNTVVVSQSPLLYLITEQNDNTIFEMMENRILSHYPLYLCSMEQEYKNSYGESGIAYEMVLLEEARDEESEQPEQSAKNDGEKNEGEKDPDNDENSGSENDSADGKQQPSVWEGNLVADEESMYPISSIKNYELALDTFYQVDSTTMLGEDLLKVEQFLAKDMTLDLTKSGPQVLIYHTHSQEGYAGSDKTVVDVGDVLTELLQNKYGISVLHHKGEYDVESRDYAYSNALPDLIRILEENPSIEVVIDLHRDGVNEDVRLVTTIDGKPTAKLMFFNGVSQTKKLGKISYLENPNLEDNLAFSFQMQLAARTYFPSLTRDIYIKGYRYNMHLMPKTLLVEVGAQTNTYEEASNAMTYLAELLFRVLTVKR